MAERPKMLDLFCCQGGASEGYTRAGFEVHGVDIEPQPRYMHRFTQADAVAYLYDNAAEIRRTYVFVHASPPCQFDSDCQRIMRNDHPDLIGPTREALENVGLPYVIENVRGALPKLNDPVELCGTMFGLETYRHRYFESSGFEIPVPPHPQHTAPQAKMGRAPKPGEFVQAVGNFSGVGRVRGDWGVGWMNRDGIREAIPPAYAQWIGLAFLAQQRTRTEAAA